MSTIQFERSKKGYNKAFSSMRGQEKKPLKYYATDWRFKKAG